MSLLANKLADFIFENYTEAEALKELIKGFFQIEKIEHVANAFRFWHKGFLYNIVYHPDTIHISKYCNSTTFGRIKEFSKIYKKEN